MTPREQCSTTLVKPKPARRPRRRRWAPTPREMAQPDVLSDNRDVPDGRRGLGGPNQYVAPRWNA